MVSYERTKQSGPFSDEWNTEILYSGGTQHSEPTETKVDNVLLCIKNLHQTLPKSCLPIFCIRQQPSAILKVYCLCHRNKHTIHLFMNQPLLYDCCPVKTFRADSNTSSGSAQRKNKDSLWVEKQSRHRCVKMIIMIIWFKDFYFYLAVIKAKFSNLHASTPQWTAGLIWSTSKLVHIHHRTFLQNLYKHFTVLKAYEGFGLLKFCIPVRVKCCSVRVPGWGFEVFCCCCFFLQLVLEPRGVTGRCRCGWWQSVVAVAVRAQNLTAVGEEARAHQRHRAARTLKARLVPLPVLERNIFPVSKP